MTAPNVGLPYDNMSTVIDGPVEYDPNDGTVEEPTWYDQDFFEGMLAAPNPLMDKGGKDSGNSADNPDGPAIRTHSGLLDFLQDVEEDLCADSPEDNERAPKADRMTVPIPTYDLPPDGYRARTLPVDSNNQYMVITTNPRRRRVTLLNTGTNPAYLSGLKSGLAGTRPDQFVLPPNVPIVILSKAEMFATCVPTQTALVSVLEEFDL